MDSQNGPRPERSATFADSGGSLLVVGTVPGDRFAQVIKWALRKADAPSRKRLIVTTRGVEPEIDTHLPADPEHKPPEEVKRIHITEQKEGESTVGTDSTDEPIPTKVIDARKIDSIGQEILQTVESFEPNDGELDAGELVVSFQQLSDLIDIHGQEGVFRLVHLLNHLFEERAGIALYHLPVERESGLVRQFEPLFDDVIDLRLQNGNLEGRYSLRNGDETSQWVNL